MENLFKVIDVSKAQYSDLLSLYFLKEYKEHKDNYKGIEFYAKKFDLTDEEIAKRLGNLFIEDTDTFRNFSLYYYFDTINLMCDSFIKTQEDITKDNLFTLEKFKIKKY